MNAKLRIVNPKLYRCPNTDKFHIDRPTEDGRFEIQQTLCANQILIIVLILRHMVILRSLLSSCQVSRYCDQAICKRSRPVLMLNNFFVFAHFSYAKPGHVILVEWHQNPALSRQHPTKSNSDRANTEMAPPLNCMLYYTLSFQIKYAPLKARV